MKLSLPRETFTLLSRLDTEKSRPALEAARWRCEACKETSELRVAEGFGQLVVLCRMCRLEDAFLRICAQRRAAKTAARRAGGTP